MIADNKKGILASHKRRSMVRRLTLVAADALALLFPFVVLRAKEIGASIIFYHISSGGGVSKVDTGVDWYFLLVFCFVSCLLLSGSYGSRKSVWDEIYVISISLIVAAIADGVVLFLAGYKNGPWYFFLSWIIAAASIFIFRVLVKKMLSRCGIWQIPTVIIGTDNNIDRAYGVVRKQETAGYAVDAIIDIGSAGSGSAPYNAGVTTIRAKKAEDAVTYLTNRPDAHIVLALDDRFSEDFHRITDYLASRPNSLDIIPSIRGLPLYGTDIVHLFGEEILMLRVRNNLSRIGPKIFKRLFDILSSLVLIVVLSPIFLLLSVLIMAEDGGGAIYKQLRVGRGGELFPCYKFRSMRFDAEEVLLSWKLNNPVLYAEYRDGNFKLKSDPRVTRIGRFMRAHSLDELPQLLNVLKGQMALIGPRPLIQREVSEYGVGIIHYYRARPGITGLWQVSGRSQTRFSDRAFYDEWYVKNWSIWLDIVILIKTVGVVLGKGGAY